MTFSEKIRYCRERAGLTQQELADMIGVSRRAVAAYETSGALARGATMGKLAKALDVSFDYLNDPNATDPRSSEGKSEYVEMARSRYGDTGAAEMIELLDRNRALFAGGELSEESKDAFFTAITKAYLMCKEESIRKREKEKSKISD